MSQTPLEYAADELLSLSIIMGSPIIIVEGFDDVPIYERISDSISLNCEVYASENILCNEAGCAGVIKNIEIIRESADDLPVEKHILGIIDRDARFYRGEVPADPAILMLSPYSIESHYTSAEVIRYLLPQFTRATNRLISPELPEEIFNRIRSSIMWMYLTSLEALRNACESDYEALFGYGTSIKSILQQNLRQALEAKKESLEDFGRSLGLNECWNDLLKICKGKWLLEVFCEEVIKELGELPNLCAARAIPQCQFCTNHEPGKCLYKKPTFVNHSILAYSASLETSFLSLEYIKERMTTLLH